MAFFEAIDLILGHERTDLDARTIPTLKLCNKRVVIMSNDEQLLFITCVLPLKIEDYG